MSPIVANIHINNEVFNKIQKILINMNNQKEGKEILKLLSFDSLNFPKNKNYKDVETIINYLEKHR